MKTSNVFPFVVQTKSGHASMASFQVQDVGRKAVTVAVYVFKDSVSSSSFRSIVVAAAKYAARKGWKKVVVAPSVTSSKESKSLQYLPVFG